MEEPSSKVRVSLYKTLERVVYNSGDGTFEVGGKKVNIKRFFHWNIRYSDVSMRNVEFFISRSSQRDQEVELLLDLQSPSFTRPEPEEMIKKQYVTLLEQLQRDCPEEGVRINGFRFGRQSRLDERSPLDVVEFFEYEERDEP